MTDRYDYITDFNQGVAIVVKDSLYGVILMGGKEIIAPSYDFISPFNDGYAYAIQKGKCMIIDLSGRECKLYEGKLIPIPEKYDYVRDFKNGYACVQQNGKWGAIDINGKEIFEPQFYFLSDFIGGTAKYKKEYNQCANSWGFLNSDGFRSDCNLMEPEIESDGSLTIERYEMSTNANNSTLVNMVNNNRKRHVRINNKGELLVKNGKTMVTLPKEFLIARNFEQGLAIVQDSTGYWGAVNVSGRIVIRLQYTRIKSFSENKAFAKTKNGKLCLISTNGTIIKELPQYSDGDIFRGGYAIVSMGDKHGLIDSSGKEILSPIDGYINHTQNPNIFDITDLNESKHGLFVTTTGLYIKPRFNKIIELNNNYIKVETEKIGECLVDLSGCVFIETEGKRISFPDWCIGVKPLNSNILKGITDNGRWGLLDGFGETICKPTFDDIGEFNNDIIPLIKKEIISGNEQKDKTKYGLYNFKDKVFIPAEYDICPEYKDGIYKVTTNGFLGIINRSGKVVLKPEWNKITYSNGYYVVSKKLWGGYSYSERFGLTNLNGDIILEIKYEDVKVIRDGLYKVKENDSWSIFNNEGRVTKESYDEIELEGTFIIVSKNGHKGRLNKHGEKVIKSEDGDYLALPSRFEWGNDFKDGIAKVFINGYENLVDGSFCLVIISEERMITIDKSIEYIVSKDNIGNYIFVADKKYGIIDHSGRILIEAKYKHLSHLAGELYIAGITKEGNHNNTYGIVDIEDTIILPFDYSTIRPYRGMIPNSRCLNDDEYITEQEILAEGDHWYVYKNGYGLIDRNGNICIPSEYDDIQKFDNGFYIKSNNKYGVVDSEYTIISEPKYSSIKSIGNGLWKVSIVTCQTYAREKEVYGILDSHGKERLSPIYQFIGDVNDNSVAKGRAIINLNGLKGLVDENYCILSEPQYEYITEFVNGKSMVDRRIYKENKIEFDIIHGELDINGTFTDISEIAKTEFNNNWKTNETQSNIKTVKILKNGYRVIQKDYQNPKYQYCAIIDNNNKIILPYKYNSIEELENGMFIVCLWTRYGKNFGVLDQYFNEVITPKYASIQPIEEVFVASYISSFKGLIDSNGRILLPFEFSAIELATCGLLWIHKENKIGWATTSGKILNYPQFGKIEQFTNGFAKVNNGYWYEDEEDFGIKSVRIVMEFSEGKWGLISSDGIFILPPVYDSITVLEDNQIKVSKQIESKTSISNICVSGVTNFKGELLIKDCSGNYIFASKKYDWQEDFDSTGQSRVFYNGNIGVVNEKFHQIVVCQNEGKPFELVLPDEFDWGYNSESQFVMIEKDHKKGIIDNANNIIIKPIYDKIIVLSDTDRFLYKCGVQNVHCNGYIQSYMWTIINVDGETLIDTQSEEIIHIGFSLLAIKNNNKYSITDFNGQLTAETTFDTVLCFGVTSSIPTKNRWESPKQVERLNYAIVGLDGKYGIIDKLGRLIIKPKYSSLEIQNNGQFLADGKLINAIEQRIVVKDNSVLIISEDFDKP